MERLKKVAKWIAAVVGVLVGVAAVGAGVASCMYGRAESEIFETPRYAFALLDDEVAADPELAREAARLFMARGCGDCHGEDGAGTVVADVPPFRLAPPNLTAVMRNLEPAELHQIVRRGINPDGTSLFFMPSHEYQRMPDRELALITAHVRSLPLSSAAAAPSEMRLMGKVLFAVGVLDDSMLPARRIDQASPFDEAGPDEIGEYIAAGCTGCHGETFSGGPIPGAPEEETGVPPNLTPHSSGLEGWTLAEFDAAVRRGTTRSGETLNPDFMPLRVYSHLTDAEVGAVYAFLQTVPAREYGNR